MFKIIEDFGKIPAEDFFEFVQKKKYGYLSIPFGENFIVISSVVNQNNFNMSYNIYLVNKVLTKEEMLLLNAFNLEKGNEVTYKKYVTKSEGILWKDFNNVDEIINKGLDCFKEKNVSSVSIQQVSYPITEDEKPFPTFSLVVRRMSEE